MATSSEVGCKPRPDAPPLFSSVVRWSATVGRWPCECGAGNAVNSNAIAGIAGTPCTETAFSGNSFWGLGQYPAG
eukprot:446419-Rhodomonas_salina.2